MRNKSKSMLSLRGSVATAAIAFLLLLLACGDDTTEVVTQTVPNYIDIVAEESDLPECTEDNEGEQVLVKGENTARTCIDDEWTAAFAPGGRDTIYLKSEKMDCYTKELADKQGVKIICDGDSVGVLLNGGVGAQGEKGIDGAGCSLVRLSETSVRLFCGGDSTTIFLGLPLDTMKADSTKGCVMTRIDSLSVRLVCDGDSLTLYEQVATIDSEKISVSLDSLGGLVQFDTSFERGAVVQLYGLGDGRALRKSGVIFTNEVDYPKESYKFLGFELPSQYAVLDVEGRHINVFGHSYTYVPFSLRALVDLTGKTSANVNLLTELEFDRANYLVTHEGMTVKQAKKQAQSEVFEYFDIDSKDFDVSEHLNYFGESDADAAMFAVSVLVLLAEEKVGASNTFMQEFVTAIETTGKWSGNDADSKKARVADAMLEADMPFLRVVFEKRKGGKVIGNFEKYIENFIEKVYAMEPCGEGSESEQRVVNNENSRFHGQVFKCHGGFITQESKNTFTNPEVDYDWMVDLRDRRAYRAVTIGEQTWMAENLNFMYDAFVAPANGRSRCLKQDCDVYGRSYTWAAAMDSAGVYSTNGKHCGSGTTCSPVYPVQGICPKGWHVPDSTELRTLVDAVGGPERAGRVLKSTSGWINESGDGENGIDSVGFAVLPVHVGSGEYLYGFISPAMSPL